MMNVEQGPAQAPAITLWQFITLYLKAQLTQAQEKGTYQSFITRTCPCSHPSLTPDGHTHSNTFNLCGPSRFFLLRTIRAVEDLMLLQTVSLNLCTFMWPLVFCHSHTMTFFWDFIFKISSAWWKVIMALERKMFWLMLYDPCIYSICFFFSPVTFCYSTFFPPNWTQLCLKR